MKVKRHSVHQTPAVRVAHLEEEGSDKGGTESEDPDGIKGVTEEFIYSAPC